MNVDPRLPEVQGPPPPPPGPAPRVVNVAEHGFGFERLLEAIRTRQRRELWFAGALLGLGAFLVLLLAGGLLAKTSVGLGRTLLVLAPIVGAGVAVFFGVFLATRQVGDRSRTARLLAAKVPSLSLDVLGAVELHNELERGGDGAFSSDLARAFLERTDVRSAQVRTDEVVDTRLRRQSGYALGGALLLFVLVLALFGARFQEGLKLALVPAHSETQAPALEPITGDVELSYRYPAYTGLAPKTVPGTNGEIVAPVGTEVTIKTRSDREVAQAKLWIDAQALPLKVTGGRALEGSFVIAKSGQYHFTFHDAKGRQTAEGPNSSITAQPDAAPEVSILTPAEEIEVDPRQKVTLKFEASDDYGLTELQLLYRLPGKAEEKIALRHDEGRRTRGTYTWDLGALTLRPGDRITYQVQAKDNDAVAGAKPGTSRTQVLKVYSAAEHRAAALEKAAALWEKLVSHLGDRLEAPERRGVKDPAAHTRAQATDSQGIALTQELAAAAREISADKDAPEELWTALLNIATSLDPKVRETSDARRIFLRYHQLGHAANDLTKRLVRSSEEEIVELEKDVLYLESLLDRQKLDQLKELADQLNAERRDLVSLVEQFKQTKDPKLQESILKQIDELKGRIDELMQKMAELAKEIRDEHLNAEALQQLSDEKDMSSQMDEIEKLVKEGKLDEALSQLQQLEMQMKEMMNALDQGDQQFGEDQFPELTEKMGEFMNQLKQTQAEQKHVAEQTKEIRDRYQKQLREQIASKAKALKEKLLRETEKAAQAYETLRPEELGYRSDKSLEQATSQLDALKNALSVDDYDLANEAAQQAAQAAQELAGQADQQRRMDEFEGNPPQLREQSRKLSQKMNETSDRVQGISDELQKLLPQPGKMMSEQDQQQMKKLGGQQRKLEEKSRQLSEQMGEMEQMAPIFGPEGMDQMKQIGERMGEAGQKLEGKDPGRSYGEQQAALDQLAQFQKNLEQSQQQGGGGRGKMPMPMFSGNRRQGWGSSPSQQKVEVPDEDAYQAPKEFRKDLLDAMKQGAPDKYKDQVKRYYEELVK